MKIQLSSSNKAPAEVKVEYAQMLDSVVVLQSYEEEEEEEHGLSQQSSNLNLGAEDENYRESIDEEADTYNKSNHEAIHEKSMSSMQTSVNHSID